MLTAEFDYTLPSALIAQKPTLKRDHSRLMILYYRSGKIEHAQFYGIDSYLKSNHLIVINNTRVFPARLYAKKMTGGKLEILLIEPTEVFSRWIAMVKPSARIPEGTSVTLDGTSISLTIGEKTPHGNRTVDFGDGNDPIMIAERYGHMPLPPYIKRSRDTYEFDSIDHERYQTVFANTNGSVAAPTASLHFTDDILSRLKNRRIDISQITLHVGPGTFLPVKSDRIEDHYMHSESFSIDTKTAEHINSSITAGKEVVAVGTTVTRTLESNTDSSGRITAGSGKTNLFIYPGYKFKTVNNMLTNFHLPKSTLLMLVCALAGREFVMEAYHEAIRERYRFYSYGDAMLLLDK